MRKILSLLLPFVIVFTMFFSLPNNTLAENIKYPFETYNCSYCGKTHKPYKITKATNSKNGVVYFKCSHRKNLIQQTIPKINNFQVADLKFYNGADKLQADSLKPDRHWCVYNGKAQTPKISVRYNNDHLVKTSDYDVYFREHNKEREHDWSKTIKNVGCYDVKVVCKGNYFTGTHFYYWNTGHSTVVDPASTKITKISAAKNSLTVNWTKQNVQSNGYVLEYSKKPFNKVSYKEINAIKISNPNTTAYTIKNLTSKTKYYIRIKVFAQKSYDNKGIRLYSPYTNVSTVTTK